MNVRATFPTADATPSDLHIRLLASAVLNGQFDGIPLNWYLKTDWIDAAQCLADADDGTNDPRDTEELAFMLAKSDYFDRWLHLSERVKDDWGDFENWFEAQVKRVAA